MLKVLEQREINNLSDTMNVFVKTTEAEFVFKYEKNCYSIKNDSIDGKGKYRLINNVEEPFEGNIQILLMLKKYKWKS